MKVHWKDNIMFKKQKQEEPVFATNYMDRQTDRQIDRQTDKWTDRQKLYC